MPAFFSFSVQIIIGMLISVCVGVICSIVLLSLPAYLTGGGFLIPNAPFSESALYGLVVGVFHGLLTVLAIYLYKADSVIGISISSILATETLIAVGFIIGIINDYLSRPIQVGKPRIALTFENAYALVLTVAFWFVLLSVLFLIPSVIIGLINKPFANLYSKIH